MLREKASFNRCMSALGSCSKHELSIEAGQVHAMLVSVLYAGSAPGKRLRFRHRSWTGHCPNGAKVAYTLAVLASFRGG